jgi:hypothetical protein
MAASKIYRIYDPDRDAKIKNFPFRSAYFVRNNRENSSISGSIRLTRILFKCRKLTPELRLAVAGMAELVAQWRSTVEAGSRE